MLLCGQVIVASHCGMKVLGLSLVTNVCITVVDSVDAPNHEEVKEMANKRAADMRSVSCTPSHNFIENLSNFALKVLCSVFIRLTREQLQLVAYVVERF